MTHSPSLCIDRVAVFNAIEDIDDGMFDFDVRAAVVAVTKVVIPRSINTSTFPSIPASKLRKMNKELAQVEGPSHIQLQTIRSIAQSLLDLS